MYLMNNWNMQFVTYVNFYHPPLQRIGEYTIGEYPIFQFVINVLDAEISQKYRQKDKFHVQLLPFHVS